MHASFLKPSSQLAHTFLRRWSRFILTVLLAAALATTVLSVARRQHQLVIAASALQQRSPSNTLCHSHQVTVYAYPSLQTCYNGGSTHSASTKLSWAIELPARTAKVLGRCRGNPYHAVYDCLWPLLHFMTVCMSDSSPLPTLVITDASLAPDGDSWYANALRAIITGLRLAPQLILDVRDEKRNNSQPQPVCFERVTRFRQDAFWRPLMFSAQYFPTSGHKLSHPYVLKHATLRNFRRVVLAAHAGRPLGERIVVVYDRGDVGRRRWINARAFARALRSAIPNTEVRLLHAMPRSFAEQVQLHAEAAVVVGGHGAAMVNTLFMREGGVVVKIDSKTCQGRENVGKEGWTRWHAAALGLLFVQVPCEWTGKRRDFRAEVDGRLGLRQT